MLKTKYPLKLNIIKRDFLNSTKDNGIIHLDKKSEDCFLVA